jgi:hypothetical protein
MVRRRRRRNYVDRGSGTAGKLESPAIQSSHAAAEFGSAGEDEVAQVKHR